MNGHHPIPVLKDVGSVFAPKYVVLLGSFARGPDLGEQEADLLDGADEHDGWQPIRLRRTRTAELL
jgi:hypothetical protein